LETKRKILHLIPALHIGGAEKLLLNTIEILPEYEHHVMAFSADQYMLQAFQQSAIVHLKASRNVLSLTNLSYLKRIEKEVRPFVIHSHLLKTNWLSRLAFKKKTNLFNSIHSPYSIDAYSHNIYSLWVERFTYKKSKVLLLFVSDYVKADYTRFISLQRNNFIVQNFVTDEFFKVHPLKYTPGTGLKLVALGNVKKSKNYQLLIDAFKQLKHLPVSLDVYGEGELQDNYREEISEHSLNINFKGAVNGVAEVLGDYHALVFPSLYEGFSVALLEAMAAGLPLILSEIPTFKLLAKSNAYFFDPKNVDSCVAAIQHAFQNGFEENAIDVNRQLVLQNFASTPYKNQLNQVYHSVTTSDEE
jgi:glycosyltransferase involved in cell wall biosynthesis